MAPSFSDDLPDDVADAVRERAAIGGYASVAEVVRDGLRLLEERERQREQFRALIQDGLDDADAGRTVDAEGVFDRVLSRLSSDRRASA